ncbi:MAG: DnaD domain protein [Clostridia bacterium]|nr:DnaD domain protein [Clostridia bacterium]
MTFSYSKEFSMNNYTNVENVFINEYLPVASEDAVRVYLYGLFLCQNKELDAPLSTVAETLKLSEEKVVDIFKYWEEFGLVSVLSLSPFAVNYLPVRSVFSGKARKYKAEKYTEFTKGIQLLIKRRMISTGEYTEYFSIMETFAIKPDAMLLIVKYCIDKKGEDVSYRYIVKVARDFGERGIVTMEKVEQELSSYVLRSSEISKVLSALSLRRQPDYEDAKYLNKWTQELGFETEHVVYAASLLKKGNMEKLDEFLLELYNRKCFSKEEIAGYTSKKQEAYSLALKINRALSVYIPVIETEVDNFINKWLSYGYEEQTLLYIATYCFKNNRISLSEMDGEVEKLYANGNVTLSSVGDFYEGIKKQNEFIEKILLTCGVNRKPVGIDRQNLSLWKSWNFSDEMILEAAKLSAGKSSPIAYLNGILSNWKNNGIYNTDEITEKVETTSSSEAYNLEYERRRTEALSTAQRNVEKAMNIEGFDKIYSRLNSIEKDLAMAEINENNEALFSFEAEKQSLIIKANDLLKPFNIDLTDLSPKYRCEKCKDTGYVGSSRCDCLKK